MSTPKIAPAPTTPAEPKRGFLGLPCPFCGTENTVGVQLSDLTVFHCDSCDTEFTPSEVRRIIAAWEPVLTWVATAPLVT